MMQAVSTLLDQGGEVPAADALAIAFDAHHQRAVRLAFLLCGDRHAAEDAVQTVWLKVHRRLQRGPIDAVGAYVSRAVVNEVNSVFRKLRVRRLQADRRSGDDRGARGHADQIADADQLLRALGHLPARTRAAVVLRFYDDHSVADTATLLGISEGTVKSSVSRGLAQLRTLLEAST